MHLTGFLMCNVLVACIAYLHGHPSTNRHNTTSSLDSSIVHLSQHCDNLCSVCASQKSCSSGLCDDSGKWKTAQLSGLFRDPSKNVTAMEDQFNSNATYLKQYCMASDLLYTPTVYNWHPGSWDEEVNDDDDSNDNGDDVAGDSNDESDDDTAGDWNESNEDYIAGNSNDEEDDAVAGDSSDTGDDYAEESSIEFENEDATVLDTVSTDSVPSVGVETNVEGSDAQNANNDKSNLNAKQKSSKKCKKKKTCKKQKGEDNKDSVESNGETTNGTVGGSAASPDKACNTEIHIIAPLMVENNGQNVNVTRFGDGYQLIQIGRCAKSASRRNCIERTRYVWLLVDTEDEENDANVEFALVKYPSHCACKK